MRETDASIPLPHIELPAHARYPVGLPRQLSLDAFRGLLVVALLLVIHLGGATSVGYFWKQSDWPAMSARQAWSAWWGYACGSARWAERAAKLPDAKRELETELSVRRSELAQTGQADAKPIALERLRYEVDRLTQRVRAVDEELAIAQRPWARIPIFTYCTLADFVWPAFVLLIGVSIPYSAAGAAWRGTAPSQAWLRIMRRAALWIVLGWILCYFRDQFAPSLHGQQRWTLGFGIDYLQLLGIAYLFARLCYLLPPAARVSVVTMLLVWQWGLLRFAPLGPIVPPGTLTEQFNAVAHAYNTWPIWERTTLQLGPVTFSLVGLLSVAPVSAVMLIGTLVGDWLGWTDIDARGKVSRLTLFGLLAALAGLLWSFDVSFSGPLWSPSLLLYASGIATIGLAVFYLLIDVKLIRGWCSPLVALGVYAIAAYFVSVLLKSVLLDALRVSDSNAVLLTTIRYSTVAIITTILGASLWKLCRSLSREVGVAGYTPIVVAIVPAVVFWMRMLRATISTDKDASSRSVGTVATDFLTSAIGAHAAWLFAITAIAFWWLVFDLYGSRKFAARPR